MEHNGLTADRFYGCYLLRSLNNKYKGQTYIGFTVNPRRRIRQHNGEITCGAGFTMKRRPWEMILCIHGFLTRVHALQFEWAWQHPKDSSAVRETAAKLKELKQLSGFAGKMRLAFSMLTLPSWSRMNLTVQFFSSKYAHHRGSCTVLPDHMKVIIAPLDELPTYENMTEADEDDAEPPNQEENTDSDVSDGGSNTAAIEQQQSKKKVAKRRIKKRRTVLETETIAEKTEMKVVPIITNIPESLPASTPSPSPSPSQHTQQSMSPYFCSFFSPNRTPLISSSPSPHSPSLIVVSKQKQEQSSACCCPLIVITATPEQLVREVIDLTDSPAVELKF